MKPTVKPILLVWLVVIVLLSCKQKGKTTFEETLSKQKPNVLLVVVDDMAWTDLGCYGSEIETPAFDALANEGTLFTDFHTSVSSSPTRAMLMTGTDNHIAGLGNMGEVISEKQEGKPGYEGHINDRVVSLAEVLKQSDYNTMMAGKWHLGHTDESIPHARGFDKSFTMLFGGASHFKEMFGLMPQETPVEYRLNGEDLNTLPDDFYSSNSYTDFLIEAIDTEKDSGRPFFAYLAFTAPHDPLHVPEPWLSQYKGKYDEGYEKLKADRYNKVVELGLLSKEAAMAPVNPAAPSWDSLSDEEKANESKKMEVYAGMVDNVDENLARVIEYLKETGQYENTIIVVTSDNGPNPWNNTDYPGNEDGVFLSNYDNSTENIGNPSSHSAYGPGWATACAGPLDFFKLTPGEGGTRTPLLISGPGFQKGVVNKEFFYVMDIMPTILEKVEADHPETFEGRDIEPMRGLSMLKVLTGEASSVHSPDEYIGGEMGGSGPWMRRGNYKARYIPAPFGDEQWKLFNVKIDPGETKDLAAEHPEILDELKQAWDAYTVEVGVIN